jgi:YD repeat-containing protein
MRGVLQAVEHIQIAYVKLHHTRPRRGAALGAALRSWLLVCCALLSLLGGGGLLPYRAQAAGTTPITYAFDADGRLTAAIDPAAQAAAYRYDAVGNITSIMPHSSTLTAIMGVAPTHGVAGTAVTITGTGFSPTASSDSITFNGTQAQVTAAGATQLVVTVPAGAASGPIHVTAPGGSATSSLSFTVAAPAAPTISGVAPPIAPAGSLITISGANFDPTAGHDVVRINNTIAQVQSASATSLVAVVPPATGSGHGPSVTTPAGTGTSPGDVFIPPSPFTPAQVAVKGRIASGQSQQVTITGSGQIALLIFDGTRGQQVSLQLANATLSAYSVTLYNPDGVPLAGPQGFSQSNVLLGPLTLAFSGTYSILLNAGTSTGSVSLTLNQFGNVQSSITPGGAAVPITISTPGQAADLTFNGTAGAKVSLQLTNATFSAYYVRILTHDNGTVAYQSFGSGSSFIDAVTLPLSGANTIVVTPYIGQTGSVTLQLYSVQDVHTTITPGGAAVPITIATPGQNAFLTFSGTVGGKVSLQLSGSTIQSYNVAIVAPDGSQLVSQGFGTGTGFVDATALAQTGTYTIFLNPYGSYAGSVTLQLYSVQDVHTTITPGGAAVPITIATPGQNAFLTFSGTTSNEVSLQLANATLQGYNVTITAPDGSQLVSAVFGSGTSAINYVDLPINGTYTIFLNPYYNYTGGVTLTLSGQIPVQRPVRAPQIIRGRPPRSSAPALRAGGTTGRTTLWQQGIARSLPRPGRMAIPAPRPAQRVETALLGQVRGLMPAAARGDAAHRPASDLFRPPRQLLADRVAGRLSGAGHRWSHRQPARPYLRPLPGPRAAGHGTGHRAPVHHLDAPDRHRAQRVARLPHHARRDPEHATHPRPADHHPKGRSDSRLRGARRPPAQYHAHPLGSPAVPDAAGADLPGLFHRAAGRRGGHAGQGAGDLSECRPCAARRTHAVLEL